MNDICIWPEGTWCYLRDLDEYLTWLSEDFRVLKEGSEEWHKAREEV